MKTRLFALVVVALLALPQMASGQTLGYKLPGSDVSKEAWTCDVPVGDSLSTYFIVPPYVDSIFMFEAATFDAGGICFEAAVDTTHYSGGRTLSQFVEVLTEAAVLDSVASTTGPIAMDITSQCKGATAIRFHIGHAAVTQTNAVRFYVFIRKRAP